MKQALLVIDVQNDYFAEGKMALEKPTEALRVIGELETAFHKKKMPIIYIQHIKESPADFFEQGSLGAQLHPSLAITDSSKIIEKQYPNSFFKTTLQQTLKDLAIEQVVITGMMTHMCVDSTTRASAELGYQPIVIADATATKSLQFNNNTVSAQDVSLSFLAALTSFSKVITAEEFLAIE